MNAADETTAQQPNADAQAEQVPTNGADGATLDIAALQAQAARAQEYLEGWQRARAEFANYKKRVERELKDSYQVAAGDILKQLLPVIDDFDRAAAGVPPDLEKHPWASGTLMIQRKLHKLLDEFSVTIIDPVGQPFDANLHEAVATDTTSEAEAGIITETLQKGYVVGDRLLRPALVRVRQ